MDGQAWNLEKVCYLHPAFENIQNGRPTSSPEHPSNLFDPPPVLATLTSVFSAVSASC
jgi:hypothetical protein